MNLVRRFTLHIALAALAVVVSGCPTILPKTAALDRLHETYRTEFLDAPFPTQSEAKPSSGLSSTNRTGAFGQTLAAIEEYRRRFPGNRTELAHLQVLEGMIYLQSGRFGMADLVAPEVAKVATDLKSAAGKITRDELLAENFGDLARGWEETVTVPNDSGANRIHLTSLTTAGSNIVRRLASLTNSPAYAPDRDSGALYVANSAAVFFVRAYDDLPKGPNAIQAIEGLFGETQTNKLFEAWYDQGRMALGWFLTTNETNPAASTNFIAGAGGRLRHIQWYHFLDRRLRASP